jgi:hypothetical protein
MMGIRRLCLPFCVCEIVDAAESLMFVAAVINKVVT